MTHYRLESDGEKVLDLDDIGPNVDRKVDEEEKAAQPGFTIGNEVDVDEMKNICRKMIE